MKHNLLKRGLAVGVAMFVVAGSTIASAASYSTTTEYANGKVTVVTNVTEATEGQQLTYLAHNGETAAETNIVYIDQQTADENGAAQFKYSATLGTEGREISSTGTKVLYGATAQTEATEGDLGTLKTIKAAADAANYTVEAVSYLPGESATFTVNVDAGYILTGVSYVMGTADAVVIEAQAGVAVPAFVITDDVVVTATVAEIAADIETATDTKAFYNFKTEGEGALAEKFVTTVATLTKAPVGVEFGILFSDAEIDTDATASFVEPSNELPAAGSVVKYKALGYGSDMKYAVKLVEGETEFFVAGKTYYTVPYTFVGGAWKFGKPVTFVAE